VAASFFCTRSQTDTYFILFLAPQEYFFFVSIPIHSPSLLRSDTVVFIILISTLNLENAVGTFHREGKQK